MTIDFRGVDKGFRLVGDKRMLAEPVGKRKNYHWAHIGTRMYLCDCLRGFRVDGKFVYGGRRNIKQFSHTKGHKYSRTRWQYKYADNKE